MINRSRIDERFRSTHEKLRNSSMEVESVRVKENEFEGKNRESDIKQRELEVKNRDSDIKQREFDFKQKDFDFKQKDFDFKQKENDRLNGNYKQLACRYEDLKLEFTRSNEKYNQFRHENQRLERELDDYKRTSEYTQKELSNMNTHLKNQLEEIQRQNGVLTIDTKNYKEEIQRYKRLTDEIKHNTKLEASQQIEDLTNNLHHKYSIEIHDLKLLQEQETIKKRQLEKNLEISSKHIANLEETLNKLREENSELNLQLNQTIHNTELSKKTLQNEIEKYYKETNEVKRRLESSNNDKERVADMMKSELDAYCNENIELKRKIELITIENEKNEAHFKSSLEKSSYEISEFRRKIDILTGEKEKTVKVLQGEIHDLGNELNNLRDYIDRVSAEKEDISNLLAQKGAEIKHVDQDRASLESQLGFYKETVEDLKYQINKLQQQITEYVHTIDRLNRNAVEWEESYRSLLDDNSVLKESINDLEAKNRQLFDNLEKELSQRAKEYKERTITMLNTPNRSTSPYLRPSTPMRHTREKSDDIGNTAAKLLEAMDSPKSVRTSQYLTIPEIYRGSTTPTKEDVRIKIASLMKNRMRIEEQIQNLNQE